MTDPGGKTQGTVNNFCSHRCGRNTRQIPIDPRDWHLLGCQVQCGGDVYVNVVGTCGFASGSYYGDQCRDSHRKSDPASRGIVGYDLAPAGHQGPSLGGLVDFSFCDFHCGFLPVCVLVPQFQVLPFEGASVVSTASGRYHRRCHNSWSGCSGSSWEEWTPEQQRTHHGAPVVIGTKQLCSRLQQKKCLDV